MAMNDQSLTIINGGVGFKMFTTCYNHVFTHLKLNHFEPIEKYRKPSSKTPISSHVPTVRIPIVPSSAVCAAGASLSGG